MTEEAGMGRSQPSISTEQSWGIAENRLMDLRKSMPKTGRHLFYALITLTLEMLFIYLAKFFTMASKTLYNLSLS